jgi:hypothetical protein
MARIGCQAEMGPSLSLICTSLVSVAKFVGLASIQARCADEIGTFYRYAPEFASTSRFVFDTGRHLPGAVVIVCMLSGAAFVPQRRDPRRD